MAIQNLDRIQMGAGYGNALSDMVQILTENLNFCYLAAIQFGLDGDIEESKKWHRSAYQIEESLGQIVTLSQGEDRKSAIRELPSEKQLQEFNETIRRVAVKCGIAMK